MSKIITVFIVFLLITKSYGQLEKDKTLHFLGGNLYGLVGAGVASQLSKGNRTWTFVGSVGGSLLIGLAKEAIDNNQYDGWDNGDLLATVLGGATVGVTLDIFKQRKKRKRSELFKKTINDQKFTTHFQMFPKSDKISLSLLAMSSQVRSSIP